MRRCHPPHPPHIPAQPLPHEHACRPPSAHREEPLAAGGDGLQLFFRSAVDTLVSFVLQAWPQLPAPLRAALHGASGAPSAAGGGAGGGGGGGAGAQVGGRRSYLQ